MTRGGVLGDDVWHAKGVLRDFFRHGRWVRLLANEVRLGIGATLPRRLLDDALGVFPPAIAQRISGWLSRPHRPPPDWMGPALRALADGKGAVSRSLARYLAAIGAIDSSGRDDVWTPR